MVIGVVHATGAAKYVHSRRKRIYPLVCATVLFAAELLLPPGFDRQKDLVG